MPPPFVQAVLLLACSAAAAPRHYTEFQIARGALQQQHDAVPTVQAGVKHSRMLDNEQIASAPEDLKPEDMSSANRVLNGYSHTQHSTRDSAPPAGERAASTAAAAGSLLDVAPSSLVRNETLRTTARAARAEARAAAAADTRAAAKAERKQAAAARQAERAAARGSGAKRKAAQSDDERQGEEEELQQQTSRGSAVGAGPAALVTLDAASAPQQQQQQQQAGSTFARAAAASRSQAQAARRARAAARHHRAVATADSDVALDRLNEGMRR